MIVTLLASFLIIVSISFLTYLLAGRLSPRLRQSSEKTSTYACGERLSVSRLVVDPSLYEYSVYFLIFDSGVFLLAFAAQVLERSSMYVVSYLLLVLLSVLFLPRVLTRVRGLD